MKVSLFLIAAIFAVLSALSGCDRAQHETYQGYVDADYVFIASPFGGTLENLAVERGKSVNKGDLLFELDKVSQQAMQSQARQEFERARATLEDLKKGLRPSEIAELEARYAAQKSEAEFARKEYERLKALASKNFASKNDLDRARTSYESSQKSVDDLNSQITTGKLGSRADQISAAEAQVMASQAALRQAKWSTQQQTKIAPIESIVFDTFYRPGEYVAPERPVLSLLTPKYLKIRFYIPEVKRSLVNNGIKIFVKSDSIEKPFEAHVTYISPNTEYTPPVIYSRDQREKLVFLIEARFNSESGFPLWPGQPVDVCFER